MQIVRWKAEAATYTVVLAVLSYLYFLTFFFGKSIVRGYPGAAFFPRLILYFTAAAALAALVMAVVTGLGEKGEARRFEFEGRDFVLTVVTIAAFVVLLPVVGFEISSFGIMFVLLGFRLDSWIVAAATALATTAVFYALFVIMLQVSLPLLFLPAYVSF